MEADREISFFKALGEAQEKIEQPKHDSKVYYNKTKFSYASLQEVLSCLKPLREHGIYFRQNEVCEDGTWFMSTRVVHVDGYKETHKTFLKNSTSSEKEFGASVTYARRYALCSIFSLYGEKDTDCVIEEVFSDKKQEAPKKVEKFISKKLQDDLHKKMAENEAFKNRVYKHLSTCEIPNVQSIPSVRETFYRAQLDKEATNEKSA